LQLAKAAAFVMAVAIDPELVRQQGAGEGDAPPIPTNGDSAATTRSAAALPDAASPPPPWVTLLQQQPLMCPRPRVEPCKASPPREPCPVCTETALPAAVRPWRWSIWAEAAIAAGVLPDLGPTLGAGLGFGDRDRWRLQLHGRYWVGQELDVPDYPRASVALRMLSGGARLCGVPFVSGWRVLGCTGPEVGGLHSAGKGDMQANPPEYQVWAAWVGSVGAEFPFGSRLLLTTSVEGGWAPSSIEVVVDEIGQQEPIRVAETSPFVANLAVRLGVALE
jgi:hypothetical protein